MSYRVIRILFHFLLQGDETDIIKFTTLDLRQPAESVHKEERRKKFSSLDLSEKHCWLRALK